MLSILIVSLIIFDVAISYFVYLIYTKKQNQPPDLLSDITTERRNISNLTKDLEQNIRESNTKTQDSLNRITILTAEAEELLESVKSSINQEINIAIEKAPEKLNKTLHIVNKKQNELEKTLLSLSEKEKKVTNILKSYKELTTVLGSQSPIDDALSEIEQNKIKTAKNMLAKGKQEDEILQETGLKTGELQLIKNVESYYL